DPAMTQGNEVLGGLNAEAATDLVYRLQVIRPWHGDNLVHAQQGKQHRILVDQLQLRMIRLAIVFQCRNIQLAGQRREYRGAWQQGLGAGWRGEGTAIEQLGTTESRARNQARRGDVLGRI